MDMREDVRQASVARFQARLRQARLDGQFAALKGRPAGDNPHPLGTELSSAWGKGWREMESGPDGA